jgi:hypothetical protein
MTTLPLEQNAVMSVCGKYRYVLTRQVGPGIRTAAFIMLNPSTADSTQDDPTIRRCIGFSKLWGCGKLIVMNLFAVRATRPFDMKRAADPVGPDNREWFQKMLADRGDGPVVCGWGVHGSHREQDVAVLDWLANLGIEPVSLGMTKDGHPKHPLYVPYDVELHPLAVRKLRSKLFLSRASAAPDEVPSATTGEAARVRRQVSGQS